MLGIEQANFWVCGRVVWPEVSLLGKSHSRASTLLSYIKIKGPDVSSMTQQLCSMSPSLSLSLSTLGN